MCKLTHMKWSTKNETHEVDQCSLAHEQKVDFCGKWEKPKSVVGCEKCHDEEFRKTVVDERRKFRDAAFLMTEKVKEIPWRRGGSYLASLGF